jgi:hypothetical protein
MEFKLTLSDERDFGVLFAGLTSWSLTRTHVTEMSGSRTSGVGAGHRTPMAGVASHAAACSLDA